MWEAIFLYTTVAIGPMPPDVVKTKGENEPCSTSLTPSHHTPSSFPARFVDGIGPDGCYDNFVGKD